jgi:hypothetical protein
MKGGEFKVTSRAISAALLDRYDKPYAIGMMILQIELVLTPTWRNHSSLQNASAKDKDCKDFLRTRHLQRYHELYAVPADS